VPRRRDRGALDFSWKVVLMKARVYVTLKPSVFDPQGSTIAEALHSLGFDTVADVRQGKYFELDLRASTPEEAEKIAAEVADRVLANPIIETFRVELPDGRAAVSGASR
jgi:phosphoribosylformylglycinamidine synthase